VVKPFLSADWRYLATLTFRIDSAVLIPFVPSGTELDFFEGHTFVSVVGFMFLDTRVLGVAIPLHRDFEEVNLRFYVKRNSPAGWKRGVVFIRELVPKIAIATIARVLYGERYAAVPMKHDIVDNDTRVAVEYGWRRGQGWESIAMTAAAGAPTAVAPNSHEEFITEHYWGYTSGKRTSEYRVEHPRWRIWPALTAKFNADVASLYGQEFVDALADPPVSQFIAEGSRVQVFRKIDDLAGVEAVTSAIR
jgi:uncharacterized protein YqjF (DUF2071 family)